MLQCDVIDSLTNLPFFDDFKSLIRSALFKGIIHKPVFASLDINNFKYFNHIYGFSEGDQLIRLCADYFCKDDACICATRNYVDHFIMCFDGDGRSQDDICHQLQKKIETFPNYIAKIYPGTNLHLSVGVYFADNADISVGEAIDKVQYARRSIKGNYNVSLVLFSQEMQDKITQDANAVPLFEKAMNDKRVHIFLQPKMNIMNHQIIGAEALARIYDEDGNVVLPYQFIPMVEKAGLIYKLDFFVLEEVAKKISQWQQEGYDVVPISVNLSQVDFQIDDIVKRILDIVERYNVEYKYIEFEITETLFCEKVDEVVNSIQELRRLGFRISMDDFGTGYNSLHTLGLIPVDVIKFDRGFVLDCLKNEMGLNIISGLIDIFDKIQHEVICEGVETEAEEHLLYDCGCKQVQGYLYDKPLVVEKFFEKYIHTR